MKKLEKELKKLVRNAKSQKELEKQLTKAYYQPILGRECKIYIIDELVIKLYFKPSKKHGHFMDFQWLYNSYKTGWRDLSLQNVLKPIYVHKQNMVVISEKVTTFNTICKGHILEKLSEFEKEYFDIHEENIGMRTNGDIVIIDYGCAFTTTRH